MQIIKNVNVDTERTHEKAAYAAQASYDTVTATITLFDGVVVYQPLQVNTDYIIDSKDLQDPVKVKYTGTNLVGSLIFLIL